MDRVHLFETSDLSWFPNYLRELETDVLQFALTTLGFYDAATPFLVRALERTGATTIVDLCSGAGGPWVRLLPRVTSSLGRPVRVELTDLHPNVSALERVESLSDAAITFDRSPVDGTSALGDRPGVRTMFTAFHHFRPELAHQILENAWRARAAIAIFEFNERTPRSLLAMLTVPFGVMGMTPFIRPRSIWRFVLTYLVPVVPLNSAWNGLVSSLRTYSPHELERLCADLDSPDYEWEFGQVIGRPASITYLLGLPRAAGKAF